MSEWNGRRMTRFAVLNAWRFFGRVLSVHDTKIEALHEALSLAREGFRTIGDLVVAETCGATVGMEIARVPGWIVVGDKSRAGTEMLVGTRDFRRKGSK